MLVFPSLTEGFGAPPLEAMSCGCPVIASNTSSVPEVCGDAVLYIDPYSIDDISDRIKLLIYDDHLRQETDSKRHEKVLFICLGKNSVRYFASH